VAERRWRLVRARRDALPDSVRRFGARARRNKLRAAAPFLGAAGVLAVLGAGFAVVFATPAFAVDRVVVHGAVLASDLDIRTAAAVRPGTPLARVDVRGVHRRVAALPAVRLVHVSRKPPGTVVIRVTERTAAAVVAVGAGLSLIDGSGVPFAPAAERPADLPLLKLAAPGPGDPSTRAALSVLVALTPPLRALLGALVADAPARVRLELTDGRTIIWGDATQSDLKARYAAVMLGKPGKIIDVSAPNLLTTR
jgi:cell division protein FtsQ